MEKMKMNLSFERDRTCGFSWPQRSYSCNFCKKQFKSAQALGGHMNVHRRERAKLRESSSSSWDCPNLNPNPRYTPYLSCHSSLASLCSQSLSSFDEEKMLLEPHSSQLLEQVGHPFGELLGVEKMKSFLEEDKNRVLKKKENSERLELGMGLLGDLAHEGLDLELRLGFS